MTRALALTSGGLDSILAAKLIAQQGIEVICICFKSPFFGSRNAENMAQQLGLELKIVDFTEDHFEMLKNPKNGYGKNMNPCIDCHAMMFRYAGHMMKELKADFLVTGEVLNQRPMSQNRKSLDIVLEESGYKGKILRPLCALNLPPTEMETSGMVDRSKLLGISGKSRKLQMELAKEMGIKDYPSPAGGCMLTEPQFSNRLKDLFESDKDNTTILDVELLKLGRHFRLSSNAKALCTRTQEEYNQLKEVLNSQGIIYENITNNYIVLNTAEYHGSTTLLMPLKGCEATQQDLELAASITARYSKGRENNSIMIKYKKYNEAEHKFITVAPMEDEQIRQYLL